MGYYYTALKQNLSDGCFLDKSELILKRITIRKIFLEFLETSPQTPPPEWEGL
jgi:hypothetical protein